MNEKQSYISSFLTAPVTAFANSLYIEFKSDLTNEMKGFKAEFYTERRKFGKIFFCMLFIGNLRLTLENSV